MKKLITIFSTVLFIFVSTCTIAYSNPNTAPLTEPDQEENVPPIIGYEFNMTKQDVHDLLGKPYEEEITRYGEQDTYQHVEYLGIDGHLLFSYEDGKVNSVGWESPAEEYSEKERNEFIDTVTQYFNNEYDEADIQEWGSDVTVYSWADDFNKTEIRLYVANSDEGTQFQMALMRQARQESISTSVTEIPATLDDINGK